MGVSPTRADGLSTFATLQAEGGVVDVGLYRSQIMRCKTFGQWKAKMKVLVADNSDSVADVTALPDLAAVFNYIYTDFWNEIELTEA
jgi:hypothetical protein